MMRLASRIDGRAALAGAALSGTALLAALWYAGRTPAQAHAAEARRPPTVSVVTLRQHDIPLALEYPGVTAGSVTAEVRARVPGILLRRLYREGERVAAGTPLFQIDPESYEAELASADAARAAAAARLAQARRELERSAPLAEANAISRKELDDVRSAADVAQAALHEADAHLRQARLNLAHARVLAPVGGIAGMAVKSDGNLVTAADSLLTTIVQVDPLYVRFSIPEADLLRLQRETAGDTLAGAHGAVAWNALDVGLTLADGRPFPGKGRITYIGPSVNPATGGFDSRAEIANPAGMLRPGQFVRLRLDGLRRVAALTVPQGAVLDKPSGKLVLALDDADRLVPRPVKLGAWSDGEWIVEEGVAAGERVVIDGFAKAGKPGMQVVPAPAH